MADLRRARRVGVVLSAAVLLAGCSPGYVISIDNQSETNLIVRFSPVRALSVPAHFYRFAYSGDPGRLGTTLVMNAADCRRVVELADPGPGEYLIRIAPDGTVKLGPMAGPTPTDGFPGTEECPLPAP